MKADFAARRVEIQTLVTRFGQDYVVRDDSRSSLTTNQGDGGAMTMDRVIDEVAQVQYLCSYQYKQIWDKDVKQIANALHARYPHVSWKRMWQLVREHMDLCVLARGRLWAGAVLPTPASVTASSPSAQTPTPSTVPVVMPRILAVSRHRHAVVRHKTVRERD